MIIFGFVNRAAAHEKSGQQLLHNHDDRCVKVLSFDLIYIMNCTDNKYLSKLYQCIYRCFVFGLCRLPLTVSYTLKKTAISGTLHKYISENKKLVPNNSVRSGTRQIITKLIAITRCHSDSSLCMPLIDTQTDIDNSSSPQSACNSNSGASYSSGAALATVGFRRTGLAAAAWAIVWAIRAVCESGRRIWTLAGP